MKKFLILGIGEIRFLELIPKVVSDLNSKTDQCGSTLPSRIPLESSSGIPLLVPTVLNKFEN